MRIMVCVYAELNKPTRLAFARNRVRGPISGGRRRRWKWLSWIRNSRWDSSTRCAIYPILHSIRAYHFAMNSEIEINKADLFEHGPATNANVTKPEGVTMINRIVCNYIE